MSTPTWGTPLLFFLHGKIFKRFPFRRSFNNFFSQAPSGVRFDSSAKYWFVYVLAVLTAYRTSPYTRVLLICEPTPTSVGVRISDKLHSMLRPRVSLGTLEVEVNISLSELHLLLAAISSIWRRAVNWYSARESEVPILWVVSRLCIGA